MLSNLEQSNGLWAQLNEELNQSVVKSVDTSSGNMYLYIDTARNKWCLIAGGLVKIASIPDIKGDEWALQPEYLEGHVFEYMRPTYTEDKTWEVEQADKFMSIDNVSLEFTGPMFKFLLQIEKFGISMMN